MKTLCLGLGFLFLAASEAAGPAVQSSTAGPPAHKSGYLEVPGGEIYYEVAGTGVWIVSRQLNIEKATVMGMSAGGALSIDFTLAHPEKVRDEDLPPGRALAPVRA